MRIAQILYNRIHHVFEADEMPNWPPDQDGNPVVLVDVTGKEANENDGYNPTTKAIIPFPVPEQREGYTAIVNYDEERCEFDVLYEEIPVEQNVQFDISAALAQLQNGLYQLQSEQAQLRNENVSLTSALDTAMRHVDQSVAEEIADEYPDAVKDLDLGVVRKKA